jgi:hypothetical protein
MMARRMVVARMVGMLALRLRWVDSMVLVSMARSTRSIRSIGRVVLMGARRAALQTRTKLFANHDILHWKGDLLALVMV